MNALQQTYIDSSSPIIRADFNKSAFDRIISEKGREVIVERALECPCKGDVSNNLSTCKNCGGTGWLWINARQTRMVLSAIDVSTKYAPWSEEARGMMSISAMCEEELSYFDKITVVDGVSVYGEVITIKQSGVNLFAYTVYDIKEILYIGLFINDSTPLTRLDPSQYTISKNIIRIVDTVTIPVDSSITLRYKHSPAFLVMEFKRETMQSFTLTDSESLISLPISAFARRLHMQVKPMNLANDWLLSNDFIEDDIDTPCQCSIQINNGYTFEVFKGDTFGPYNINVSEGSNTNIAGRTYIMQVKDTNDALITEFTVGNGGIQILLPNVVKIEKTSDEINALTKGVYQYKLKETNGDSVDTILFGNFIVK